MTSNEPNWTPYALTADPGKPLREAKADIVILTGDIEMLNGIIKGLRQMLADVEPAQKAAEQELHQHHELLKLVVDGATRLRAERDEARREVCRERHYWKNADSREQDAQDEAAKLGWDCFEKDGNA